MTGPEPPIDHTPHTPLDRMELEDLDNEHVDLQDPSQNTYKLVKRRQEKHCFKIEDPFVFVIVIAGKKDIAQHNHVVIKQLYHNKC
jgi:hypothetical protein